MWKVNTLDLSLSYPHQRTQLRASTIAFGIQSVSARIPRTSPVFRAWNQNRQHIELAADQLSQHLTISSSTFPLCPTYSVQFFSHTILQCSYIIQSHSMPSINPTKDLSANYSRDFKIENSSRIFLSAQSQKLQIRNYLWKLVNRRRSAF